MIETLMIATSAFDSRAQAVARGEVAAGRWQLFVPSRRSGNGEAIHHQRGPANREEELGYAGIRIDYSDISPISREQLRRMKAWRSGAVAESVEERGRSDL
jgi:hypothetical protein